MYCLGNSQVDEVKKAAFIKAAEDARDELNRAVQEIRANEIKINSVDDLKAVTTPGWLRSYIDNAKEAYLGNGGFVPYAIRERDIQEFERVYQANERPITKAASILAEHPYKLNMTADGRFFFSEKEIREEATKRATMLFTDEDKECYALLGEIVEAINKLTAWEREHDWLPFSTKGISMPPAWTPPGVIPAPTTINIDTIAKSGLNRATFVKLKQTLNFGKDMRKVNNYTESIEEEEE